MSGDFTAEFETARERLLADGFEPIAEHKGLAVGVRVRHGGERYPEALERGTGWIRWIGRRRDRKSDEVPWEATYGRPNIELLIETDKPRLTDSRLMSVADYHVTAFEHFTCWCCGTRWPTLADFDNHRNEER